MTTNPAPSLYDDPTAATSSPVTSPADLVLFNGNVVTVDNDFRIASAIAVRGNTIAALGGDDEVRLLIGPETRAIDLDGRTVLPGINDSHLHGVNLGLTSPPHCLQISYPQVQSIADIVEVVKEATRNTPEGEWIFGRGWDVAYLKECDDKGRSPDRFDLDQVSPNHPVYLQDFSGHAAWVNTAALQAGGVGPQSAPGAGGVIEKDNQGEPTGVLREAAQALVKNVRPAPSPRQMAEAIGAALEKLRSLGITSITEPGLEAPAIAAYADLLANGELTTRVNVLFLATGLDTEAEQFKRALDGWEKPAAIDPRRLAMLGVKVFADGIPPNRTSWMHEPYVDGGHGALCVHGDTDEARELELNDVIRHAHNAGHQIGVHVTGDRAIDAVVDAFAAAQKENPREDPRHYVIHGDFLTPRSMKVLKDYGFGVNMNPAIKWTIAEAEEAVVGPERAAYEWPYRDALDAGLPVTSGSDAPVTTADWRQGLATMLLREGKATGKVSGPEQRITLSEAIRTYTINAAWQDFAEEWKGSLEVGKVADLCILDGDLLSTAPREIPQLGILYTVFDGKMVYEAPATAS